MPTLVSAAHIRRGRLHVLAYHGISAHGGDPLSLTPAQFAAQMTWLHDNGAHVVSLVEGLACLRRGDHRGPLVALTFDDGYADFGDHAAPVLAQYGFPATLFIVSDKIGQAADWQGAPRGRPLLGLDALRELAQLGHCIGSHTATHARLTRLTAVRLDAEIRKSKARLAEATGVVPAAFAYPYGDFGRRERDAVAAAGYLCACSIRGWSNAAATDPFALRRIEMWGGYSMHEFAALMTARLKWPRLTRAGRHIAGGIQNALVRDHPESPFTHH
ncbi:MAG: polysaccharide deacetylase family protein [Anaerolineae bacterium]